MTRHEFFAAYVPVRARFTRVQNTLLARAKATWQDAGVSSRSDVATALADRALGRPWRAVDYDQLETAYRLLRTIVHAEAHAQRYLTRLVQQVTQ